MSLPMKIWIGQELEGIEKGKITIFVKGISPYSNYLIPILDDHVECRRIYLGAGRTDVLSFSSDLIAYCIRHGITVAIETSPEGLKFIPPYIKDYCHIVVRFDVPQMEQLALTDSVKIDTGKSVRVVNYENMILTDLEDLDGDMFKQDELIFSINIKEETD